MQDGVGMPSKERPQVERQPPKNGVGWPENTWQGAKKQGC
ncbi:hypothetical protein SynBIOSU31_01313 [Synechococcus sp. BIOS-U3-1]|nr:hypothetical protein SynBIOSU31_01313 [Synechococcus sp. BIOS-U3-1]